MYYRQPFRVYSCVINFHFKAIRTRNDVGRWGFEVVRTFEWDQKKERGKAVSRRSTKEEYALETRAPEPPRSGRGTHERRLRVTVWISWPVSSLNYHVKAGLLTAWNTILSMLSSYLFMY